MFELVVFLVVLAIIRLLRRVTQPQQIRIDVFHHVVVTSSFPDGGPGELQPEDQLIDSNVVQLRRR